MAVSEEFVVINTVGLHARPAAALVKIAASYQSAIRVENLTRKTHAVNAKSLMSVLSIGVRNQDRVRITSDGEDEKVGMVALAEVFESNFGENKKVSGNP